MRQRRLFGLTMTGPRSAGYRKPRLRPTWPMQFGTAPPGAAYAVYDDWDQWDALVALWRAAGRALPQIADDELARDLDWALRAVNEAFHVQAG